MNELSALLNGIEDSYFDFVSAMLHYAEKKPSRREKAAKLIIHPFGIHLIFFT